MSYKGTKEKDKEEAKVEGPQAFADICRQVMSGKAPACCGGETPGTASGCCGTESQETASGETGCGCGPEMQGMMARMMSAFQPQAEK
jgi:hypothetical protein